MPTVVIPPPYQGPTGGIEKVEVAGKTVRECLDAVESQFPGFGPLVFDEGGAVHRFVRLFVNGEPLERGAVATPVSDGDVVEMLSPIAGG